jgi:hypothetical protein
LHFRVFISRPGRHFVEAAYAVNNLWLNRDQGGVSEPRAAAARHDAEESRTKVLCHQPVAIAVQRAGAFGRKSLCAVCIVVKSLLSLP